MKNAIPPKKYSFFGAQKNNLKTFLLLFATVLFSVGATAQNKPFPQQINWENCIKPNNVSQAQLNTDVAAFYEIWKSEYLRKTDMSGGYYVHGECTGCTEPAKGTSEGHGWGMLITVLMAGHDADAKTYYDGFYKYFDQHRSPFNDELMSWMVEFAENGGEATATDGDLDIAYSLLLAHDQWGSNGAINYLQEAKDMITNGLKVSDMNVSTQRVMLGTWDTDGNSTRSSDWMTAQFRAYQAATNDTFWNGAINTSYDIMNNVQGNYSKNTGLMPDFIVGSSPRPADPNFLESVHDGDYNWNACRFPWRVAMDYSHYGNTDAKAVVNKVVNWAKSTTNGNPANYKAGYTLDGSPLVEYTSNAFIAPLIVASTVDASHQQFLNSGWDYIKDSYYSYYDASINMLCMLAISGNWWIPLEGGNASVPTPIENSLTVNTLNSFNANEGSQNLTIASNVSWTVTENSSWISVNTTNGSNDGSVSVSVSENTTSAARSADITISGAGITRTVSVTQAAGTIVTAPSPTIDYLDIPALIEAENYSTQEGTRSEASQDLDNGTSIGYVDQGDSLSYAINVPSTDVYTLEFRVASRVAGVHFDIYQGNVIVGAISSPATGGWYNWETISTTVNLFSGEQTIKLVATQSGWNINWLEFLGENDVLPDPTPTEPTTPITSSGCSDIPAWNANTIYSEAGTQVSHNGNIYENKWYTLNQNPDNFSQFSWDLWTLVGACESAKSIASNGNAFDFTAYPNPFTTSIHVTAASTNQTIGSLQLVNLLGEIIISESGASLTNLSEIAKGMYLVQVLNTKNQIITVKKLIKK